MPYITTRDQTTIYLKDWGAGRPIIFIHGWPLSADTWDEVAMALAEAGLRTIAYDRRGFGRSSQPWRGYDYDTLADDLADVIEATGARDAVLVGFSMGGGEVARYMSRHDGRHIAQAVLVASVVPYMLKTDSNPHGVEQSVFDQMVVGLRDDRAKFFTSFFKTFYGEGLLNRPVSGEVLHWSQQMAMMAGLNATIACTQSFASTDFRGDLSTFRVPTLIVHGTGDKIVPIDATGRAAAGAIPRSKLVEYDGAPHGLLVTHRQPLIGDLLDFVLR